MKRDNHAAVKKMPSNMHILKLSFVHFAVGMILLLAAMIMAIGLIPELAHDGTFRVAEGWLFTHMLLLGFASLTAIGASYQLIQVILRTSLFSRMLGWVHFVFYLSGLVFIFAGFTLNILDSRAYITRIRQKPSKINGFEPSEPENHIVTSEIS